ncbi:MAG: PilZ domain-containing protein [Desulfobacteraceae bacterium]|nr:PilZ domain-containing protein [Desulfobacteraceae bacterium]
MNVDQYLTNLPEKTPVAVNVPVIAGDVLKCDAVAVLEQPPVLEVLFPPGVLPEPDRIDTAADCLVFIETGEIVTLICTIEEIPLSDFIRVTVRNVIQHAEKREFFRGTATRLSVSWRKKGPSGQRKMSSARGVNISCGGMLMISDQELRKKEKLAVEIRVPKPVEKTLKLDAIVLRVNQVRKNKWQVAVRFTNMDSESCDDIMAYCFAEQRRLLREQVITRDL